MGRQTKRKWRYALYLLALAGLTLALAWGTAHPGKAESIAAGLERRLLPGRSEEWISLPGAGASYGALDHGLIRAGAGQICAMDPEGNALWRLEAEVEDPVIRPGGGFAAVYEPGGRTLWIAGMEGAETISVPQGIDQAAVGPEGRAAVITCGSGYLTETRLYDPAGVCRKTISLRDSAMAMMAWCGETLASCVVTGEGWLLRLDGPETELTVPLTAELVYDLQAMGEDLALWTDQGISCYDRLGRMLWQESIPDGQVLDWDCGAQAALLIRRDSAYHILLLSPDGKPTLSPPLPRRPQLLRLCNNYICLLDRQSLLVYDKQGVLRESYVPGGRAAAIAALEDGVLLVGGGCLRYHILS